MHLSEEYPEKEIKFSSEAIEHIAHSSDGNIASSRRLIINYLTKHASAAEEELIDFTGLDTKDAHRLLEDLLASGIIETMESTTPTIYRLKA